MGRVLTLPSSSHCPNLICFFMWGFPNQLNFKSVLAPNFFTRIFFKLKQILRVTKIFVPKNNPKNILYQKQVFTTKNIDPKNYISPQNICLPPNLLSFQSFFTYPPPKKKYCTTPQFFIILLPPLSLTTPPTFVYVIYWFQLF